MGILLSRYRRVSPPAVTVGLLDFGLEHPIELPRSGPGLTREHVEHGWPTTSSRRSGAGLVSAQL